MKKQLGYVALATLAFGLSACEGTDDIGGETFEARTDLFTEGTLIEFTTRATSVTSYYMQHDAEVKNIKGFGNVTTDIANGFDACGEVGNVLETNKYEGTGTYHIVGKQTAYITPAANSAEIASDYSAGHDSDDVLTYRDGWLDIVNPTINPQYYQNLECNCFADPIKNAEIELYYSEYNSQVSATYDLLYKSAINPATGNSQSIVEFHDYTDPSAAPEISNDLHLFGWYGLEGYLWEIELLSDNSLTPTSSGGFPMQLAGNVNQMLPEDAQVGDSWFSTQSNSFGRNMYTQGYLYSVVAEKELTVKDADGEDRTITALHVVRRGADQEDLLDDKIIGTTCFGEETVSEGNNVTTKAFFEYDKCRETSWVNEGHYWYYNNVLVKRIEDKTTINVNGLRSGYREVPNTSVLSNTLSCDEDNTGGDGYFDIITSKDVNDTLLAGYKPYVEYTVTRSQSEWVATLVRDDATLANLYEEENAPADEAAE